MCLHSDIHLACPVMSALSGGTVEFSIAGAGFSTSTLGSWSAVLVPYFDVSTLAGCTLGSSCPLADQVNDALAATQPCRQLTAVDAQTARCTLRALPAGRYLLALQGPGYSLVLAPGGSSTRRLQQAAPSGGPYVLEVALGVSAVWPAVGSIGGGALLTVQGEGYHRQATNAVPHILQKAAGSCLASPSPRHALPATFHFFRLPAYRWYTLFVLPILCYQRPTATSVSGIADPSFSTDPGLCCLMHSAARRWFQCGGAVRQCGFGAGPRQHHQPERPGAV